MRKMMRKLLITGLVAPFFFACSAEDASMDKSSQNVTESAMMSADIQSSDLIGTWKVISMETFEVPVDLDLNGTSSNDVLSETTCFNEMYFTFTENEEVKTQQSNLFFDTQSGAMECRDKYYESSYEVVDNELVIYFTIKGVTFSETRDIEVLYENGEEYLVLTVTYQEAKGYFSDPEFVSPTGATNVEALNMVYQKQ